VTANADATAALSWKMEHAMRTFLLLVASAWIAGCGSEPVPQPAQVIGGKLAVGDNAPNTLDAEWLKGSPVAIEPLPADTPIHFGWCETAKTFDAWMGAAKLNALPMVFVVSTKGTLSYIEHPVLLPAVLPDVLDGTWKDAEDSAKLDERYLKLIAIYKRVQDVGDDAQRKTNPDAGLPAKVEAFNKARKVVAPEALKAFDKAAKAEPVLAATPLVRRDEMLLCLLSDEFDRAKSVSIDLLTYYRKTGDDENAKALFALWIDKFLNRDRKHLEIARDAAELMLSLRGDEDLESLLAVAESSKAIGNKARADDMIAKARKLTEKDPARREIIEKAIRLFD
jgi:hypothetical protein